jgi:Na+/H+ antiporter NhaD/arsenite permease-like protein
MEKKQILSLIIYGIVYVLISLRRLKFFNLGRTGIVLFGVVLMFIFKIFTANEFISLIDWDTIILLFSLMIVIEYLDEAGFFDLISYFVFKRNLNPKKLLLFLNFLVGISSAFFINDISCLILTPIILRILLKRGYAPLPYLIAIATSSNIGAIISFTGAPQNMIIGNVIGLTYAQYFILMFPLGLLLLYLNYLLLTIFYRKSLKMDYMKINNYINKIDNDKKNIINEQKIINNEQNKKVNYKIFIKPLFKRSLTVTVLIFIGFFIYKPISWVALIGAVLLIIIARKNELEYIKRIDWNLLIFFIGLFGLIGALNETKITIFIFNKLFQKFETNFKTLFIFNSVSLFLSNIFSNVPYVLIVKDIILKQPSSNIWFLY